MNKYLSFFRIRFRGSLQYRVAAWAGISTQFAWGFMSLLLYAAFYRADPAAFPMSRQALNNYIWLQQGLLALLNSWYYDNEIFEGIRSGGIAYELCRPIELYTMWFLKTAAVRVARTLLRCLPIFLVAALLPVPWGMTLPASPAAGLLFVCSLALGLWVVTSIGLLVYTATLRTLSVAGLRALAIPLMDFLAGGIVPIPFFPEGVARAVSLLPFASIQNTPFQIYAGTLTGAALWQALALQAFWAAALTLLGRALMSKAMNKVLVQGG